MNRSADEPPLPLRVLLAEASPLVREGLRQMLAELAAVTIVGEAASGAELQSLLRTTRADLILFDLGLPCADLSAAIADCKLVQPGARLIALSQFASPAVERRCRAAGADSVISKTAGPELMGEAIAHSERSPPLDDEAPHSVP